MTDENKPENTEDNSIMDINAPEQNPEAHADTGLDPEVPESVDVAAEGEQTVFDELTPEQRRIAELEEQLKFSQGEAQYYRDQVENPRVIDHGEDDEPEPDRAPVRETAIDTEDTRDSGRVPLGSQPRLEVPQYIKDKYPDCTFRWINNEHGRIDQARKAGFIPVEGEGLTSIWNPNKNDADRASQVGSVMMQPVGIGRSSDAISAVLMRQKLKYFQEDRKYESDKVREIEKSLKRGQTDGIGTTEDGVDTYAPNVSRGGPDGDIRGIDIEVDKQTRVDRK